MKLPLAITVVVHHNHIEDTLECIESLISQKYSNHLIVFVDNDSRDEGFQSVKLNFPKVNVIHNPKNLGFTGGYNAGIVHALQLNAEYVFIVNNDTVMASDGIGILVKSFMDNIHIGVVSPIIYYYDNPDQIWSAGGKVSKVTLEMIDNHGRNKSWTKNSERDFLSGCAMMFKRCVLEEVGLFDESFISYFEDLDLSLRVRKAGYLQVLVPNAIVWHKVSQTGGGQDNPLERYFMGRNSFYYFRKHASLWQWFFIIPKRFLSTIKVILRMCINGNTKSIGPYLNGIRDGLFSKLEHGNITPGS